MYSFGQRSLRAYQTLHPDLKMILDELIKYYDFSILEGHRPLSKQQKYYREGKSKLDGIIKKSKHQTSPSLAVDLMPYKKNTNAFSGHDLDTRRFYVMMGMAKAIAMRLKEEGKIEHDVRFGMDWDSDDTFTDQSFHDLPHMELTKRN